MNVRLLIDGDILHTAPQRLANILLNGMKTSGHCIPAKLKFALN